MIIRRLSKTDDRSGFECGHPSLDYFFQRYAGQNQWRHYIGTTYVAVEDDANILGFVSVSIGQIELTALEKEHGKHLPNYSLPVLRVARLATSLTAQGQGVARQLLRFTMTMALELRETVGCVALVVDAKPEAVSYYERFGFKPFASIEQGQMSSPDAPLPMYLTTKLIARARPSST